MRAELINTGSELLLGQVLNTHLRFLADSLWPIGLTFSRQSTVPDGEVIREALGESFERAEIVFLTGGLGPTTDDITRDLVAEMLALPLELDPRIEEGIRERLSHRNIHVTDRILRQAYKPRGAEILTNRFGTAPGLYLPPSPRTDAKGKLSPHLFLLPGPPRELQPMVETEVLPRLRRLVPQSQKRIMRVWRVVGVPESVVEEAVGEELVALNVELGYCARPGEVDVRVVGTPAQIETASELLAEKLSASILPEEASNLEHFIVSELARRGRKLSTVESCTGGALADHLTNIAGCSGAFGYGYVTYSNEAKVKLGVPEELLRAHGAVSEPVAAALARSALAQSGADYALATTGIAGPTGGSDEKPVGTVFIALAVADGGVSVEKHHYRTDRLTFKNLVTQTALNLLRRALIQR